MVGWSVVLFYSISTLFGSFNAELNFKRISLGFVYKQLRIKTVLFQTFQFSISMQFSAVWPTNKTLSGATLSQSGPGSDGNKGVLCISQSSSITRTSTSNWLVSYPGHSLGRDLTSLQRSSFVFYSPGRLSNTVKWFWELLYNSNNLALVLFAHI